MAPELAPAEESARRPEGGSAVREILLAAVLTAFLFAAFLVLPLAGSLALPFVAVPAVRLTHRRGIGAGLAAALPAVACLAALALAGGAGGDAAMLAVFGAALTLLPAAAAAGVRRGLRPSLAYLGLCVAGAVFLAGGLLVRSESAGRSMRTEIAATFEQMTQTVQSDPSRGDGEAAARLKATLSGAKEFAEKFWPGLVGASWVLGAAIGFYTGARLARPSPSAVATRFEKLSVPAPAVALFVAAGAGLALAPHPVREAAGNLLLPLASLYFVAGLSIICHFARRWFRGRIIRIGLYALAIYFPVSIGVGLLGLFDWYANFRRRGEGVVEKS